MSYYRNVPLDDPAAPETADAYGLAPRAAAGKDAPDLRKTAVDLQEAVRQASSSVLDNYYNLQENLSALCDSVRNCSMAFSDFRDHADGANLYPGLERLCALYRDLAPGQSENLQVKYAADALRSILSASFGLEEIAPKPGDPYRPELADRMHGDMPMGTILKCVAVGWSYRGQILQRAVVATTDGTELE